MIKFTEPLRPDLLPACQYTVNKYVERKRANSINSSNNISEMFPRDDVEDEEESILSMLSEIPSSETKKKKKKNKRELSPEELERREQEKAIRKAQKEEQRKAHLEAKLRKKKEREEQEALERKQQAEITSIELLARKEYLLNKLDNMDFRKKKSASKIADINIELKDIEFELNYLRNEYGIEIRDINEGSKIKKFFRSVNNGFHKFLKKGKKFIKNNSEVIVGLSSVILPVVCAYVVKVII